MSTQTLDVVGMTCEHCATAVAQEIRDAAPQVRDVHVDLASGRVTVTAWHEVDDEVLAQAVSEAGYALA